MATIAYVAQTRAGATVRGQVDAPSVADAIGLLQQQGLTPLDLRGPSWLTALSQGRRIKIQVVAYTLRRMGYMLSKAGVPLPEVLPALAQETEDPGMRAVMQRIAHSVIRDGLSLSEALARVPEVFPAVVTQRIAAGEEDGTLDEAILGAAQYMLQAAKARGKILGAMAYPGVVLALTAAIVSGLSITIMPKFAAYFADAHVPLPLLTRVVLAFGNLLAHGAPFLVLAVVAAGAGARYVFARPDVRAWVDERLWHLPGWKRIVRSLAWARWAYTMAALYGHGIQIVRALELACDGAGTTVIQRVKGRLIQRVTQATPLAVALEETGVFPPLLIKVAAMGEAQGALDRMLEDVGDQYQADVDLLLEHLPQLVQPVLIVVVGAVISVFLLSLYWPLMHLYTTIAAAGSR